MPISSTAIAALVSGQDRAALLAPVLSAPRPRLLPLALALLAAIVPGAALAQRPVTLTVDPASVVTPVSPSLYGLMTEEINYSYDGGLYAELVRNRTFVHDWSGFPHWDLRLHGDAAAKVDGASEGPSQALPKSLRLTITNASATSEVGLVNEGYWGMAVSPSTTYKGSFYANPTGITSAHVRLISDDTGTVVAEASVPLTAGAWKRYSFTLASKSGITRSAANHLVVSFAQPGTVLLQLVSLFPPTFGNRPDGNRPDLINLMHAMSPHFLRLPGGNYLEGDTYAERFNWKETIGPLVDRPTHRSPWDYVSTDGMGLLEFMGWCEDLKIEPLLAVYAGFSLKGERHIGKDLDPIIQDDLDEIEYLTGDASSKWGALRVRDGHPAPFAFHYIEIGNEDQFDKTGSYNDRFEQIATAIRAKYPQYKLIATTDITKGNPDLIDEHFYKAPEEFFAMAHYYDKRSRTGPKVFVGEWATRTGSPTPNFGAALGDAAWMTGMERNSDLILMSSYAPMLTNVNPGGMQWSSDLIGYNALSAYGSPSYWAQVLFARHLGANTVRTEADHQEDHFFWSATVSADKKTLFLKLVNASSNPQPIALKIPGVKSGSAPTETLHAPTYWTTNSITDPDHIHPIASTTSIPSGAWNYSLPANTIAVMDIPLR